MKKHKFFSLKQLFKDVEKGYFHASNQLDEGNTPLIGCGFLNQGLEGFFDLPEDKTHKSAITIAGDGSYPLSAFYHPYRFGAKDNVTVCVPKSDTLLSVLFYILLVINNERWRFSYGRKCYSRKIENLKFSLPIDDNEELDKEYMKEIVTRSSPYWKYLEKHVRKVTNVLI